MNLLPIIKLKTKVYLTKPYKKVPWPVAQGREVIKGRLSTSYLDTVEINMVKLIKDGLSQAAAQSAAYWIRMKVSLSVREELKRKGIRQHISTEGERTLSNAYMTAISSSAGIKKFYTATAIQNLLEGEWDIDPEFDKVGTKLRSLMRDWLIAGTSIEDLADKSYLTIVAEEEESDEVDEEGCEADKGS